MTNPRDSTEIQRSDIPGPWYVKIVVGVFSKYGLATMIAIVFVGCSVYVGMELLVLLRVASERHFQYIDMNASLMEKQSHALDDLNKSSGERNNVLNNINDSNQRQEELQRELLKETARRGDEHMKMLEAIREKKP